MTRQNFVENNQEFLCRQEMMEKFRNQKKRRGKNKWGEEERNGGGSKILTEKRRNEWLNTKNILINNYSPSPSPSPSLYSSNNSIITSKSLNNLSSNNSSTSTITTLPTLEEINKNKYFLNQKINEEKNIFKKFFFNFNLILKLIYFLLVLNTKEEVVE
ncbi:unnamed protein product [Meloidogyne enterolobii]|uniref:Uncharacterized protein n=1 Tax=Meloidogyne enterolobii TaxID=390850 RepID=A0ACB0XP61_MELEN